MPDPVSGTGQARSGIQNALNLLDSGFRRNDGKENFSTFYEAIIINHHKNTKDFFIFASFVFFVVKNIAVSASASEVF